MAWQGIHLVYQNIYRLSVLVCFPACSHKGSMARGVGSKCFPWHQLLDLFKQAPYKQLKTCNQQVRRLLVLIPVPLSNTWQTKFTSLPPKLTSLGLLYFFSAREVLEFPSASSSVPRQGRGWEQEAKEQEHISFLVANKTYRSSQSYDLSFSNKHAINFTQYLVTLL